MNKFIIKFIALTIIIGFQHLCYAQTFTLVKTLPHTAGTGHSPAMISLGEINGIGLFVIADGSTYDLWATQGNASNTVKILSGVSPINSIQPDAVIYNGKLHISVNNATSGVELWTSDGTASGTAILKDINPSTNNADPRELVVVNGTLYFTANNGTNGRELWQTDGTTAGTKRFKDIAAWWSAGSIDLLEPFGNRLVYRKYGDGLYITDFTSSGTSKIFNSSTASPDWIAARAGKIYFRASNATVGQELWVSDGTLSGSSLVKDINPGTGSSRIFEKPVEYNGNIYFHADDGTHGYELWESNGTSSGTSLVLDYSPGPGSTCGNYHTGKYYYTFNNKLYYCSMVHSDGTSSGTLPVKMSNGSADIRFTPIGYNVFSPMVEFEGKLYFGAHTYPDYVGIELYSTDGTQSGTKLEKDFFPSSTSISSRAYPIDNFGGDLFIRTLDASGNLQLWKLEGSSCDEPIVVYFSPSAYGLYNISTKGGNNGFIRTFILGGAAPFTYTWIGPGNPVGPNPNGLKAGSYFLHVEDKNGCKAVGGPFNLYEP